MKTSNFILRFSIFALFLSAATGLTGCDISPEKHHDMQAKHLNGDDGPLNDRPAKAGAQSFNERGASS